MKLKKTICAILIIIILVLSLGFVSCNNDSKTEKSIEELAKESWIGHVDLTRFCYDYFHNQNPLHSWYIEDWSVTKEEYYYSDVLNDYCALYICKYTEPNKSDPYSYSGRKYYSDLALFIANINGSARVINPMSYYDDATDNVVYSEFKIFNSSEPDSENVKRILEWYPLDQVISEINRLIKNSYSSAKLYNIIGIKLSTFTNQRGRNLRADTYFIVNNKLYWCYINFIYDKYNKTFETFLNLRNDYNIVF